MVFDKRHSTSGVHLAVEAFYKVCNETETGNGTDAKECARFAVAVGSGI